MEGVHDGADLDPPQTESALLHLYRKLDGEMQTARAKITLPNDGMFLIGTEFEPLENPRGEMLRRHFPELAIAELLRPTVFVGSPLRYPLSNFIRNMQIMEEREKTVFFS